MEFSRQEYWRGLPLPLQGIFLTQESNLCLLKCWWFFTAEPLGKSPTTPSPHFLKNLVRPISWIPFCLTRLYSNSLAPYITLFMVWPLNSFSCIVFHKYQCTPSYIKLIVVLRESIPRQIDKKSGSLRRRKRPGAFEAEIGVWNSQGGGKDKHLFFSTFLSLSHIKCFFKPGIDDHTANILNILNSVLRIK